MAVELLGRILFGINMAAGILFVIFLAVFEISTFDMD